jgi:hypothetical protein
MTAEPVEYRDPAWGPTRAAIDAVVFLAMRVSADAEELVRVQAAGTLYAADWTLGVTSRAPVTGRAISAPGRGDVQLEYLAAVEARVGARTRVHFAHDSGVVDWLAFLVDPLRADRPWWAGLLDEPGTVGRRDV